jgi:ATP-dependent helicase/nuclease subunit A
MEITRDEVRVMTVHGAKGLEAPIVFLADTTTPPAGPTQRPARLFTLDSAPGTPIQFVWAGRKANDAPPLSAARARMQQAAEDEYRRLLYVAMTRAMERLIVCGAEGVQGPPPGCWWKLVTQALVPLSTEELAEDGDGKVWRFCKVPPPVAATPPPSMRDQAALSAGLPSWLERDAPAEPAGATPLSPSRAYDGSVPRPAGPAGGARERAKALARGTLVHRLLQALPDIPIDLRREATRRHLARRAGDFTAEECECITAQVCRVLDDPRFSVLFAPGGRAEIPVVGRLSIAGRTFAVSGQLDRLAVTHDTVLIADFKTNRPPPRLLDGVPSAYICQLALYRGCLQRLYPDKEIRAALIWTEIPELMEIPAVLMDAALHAVTSV